jgi:microcystin-dependent protein
MEFYLGQIGIFGFNFAPVSWALCNGATLPISQNTALYSLIGTIYGGNGQTTFNLPNLQSRTPMGMGSQTTIGEMAGVENVTLLTTEIPTHNHLMQVNNALATKGTIAGDVFAAGVHATAPTGFSSYAPAAPNVTLAPQTISFAGSTAPHTNIQPYLAINYCIATSGIYPSRN